MRASANEVLRAAIAELRAKGSQNAATDARWLLAYALGVPRDRLTLALAGDVSAAAITRFERAIKDRIAHKPVAQIIGCREFYGRSFSVTSDVLDPRPETEILVSTALNAPFARVLDLGAGSGCILLSLLAERPNAWGVGVDISPEALAVARKNARSLGLEDRAEFTLSDWFSHVSGTFDLIVANPPYIATDEMATLGADVRLWEPMLALTPGPLGLEAYQQIAATAPDHLSENGRILLETGPTQSDEVVAMFESVGLSCAAVHRDLDGRNRVVELKK